TIAPVDVDGVVDHDRVESAGRIRVGPGDFQLVDIRLLDLIEIDVVRAVGPGKVVVPPFAVPLGRPHGPEGEKHEQRDEGGTQVWSHGSIDHSTHATNWPPPG